MNNPFLVRYGISALFAACIGMGAANAETLVVTDSSVPGLEEGDEVDGSDSVDVPEGTEVSLIAESGETVTHTGPYSGNAGDDDADEEEGALGRLGKAIFGDDTDSDMGAVRSTQWPKTDY